MKQSVKRILSHLLLVLYLLHHISCNYFYHSHTDMWGDIFTHSHPYLGGSESSPTTHTHSSAELNLISLLNHTTYEGATTIVAPLLIVILLFVFQLSTLLCTTLVRTTTVKGRAPPICC